MIHLDDSTLNEYLDSALPAARRVEVESHLASCAECVARLASLRALFASLESLPDLPLDRDLSSAVLNTLRRIPTARPSLAPAMRLVFAAQAIFALIALAIAAPFAIQLAPTELLVADYQLPATFQLPSLQPLISYFQSPISNLQSLVSNLQATLSAQLPMYTLLATLAAASLLFIVGNGVLLNARTLQTK